MLARARFESARKEQGQQADMGIPRTSQKNDDIALRRVELRLPDDQVSSALQLASLQGPDPLERGTERGF